MSAIKQYIDLFRDNESAFTKADNPAIKALRKKALAVLEQTESLPAKKDEGFARTSVEDMFAPDYGINLNRMNFPTDVAKVFKCDVPNLSTLLGLVLNDVFVPTNTLVRNLGDGVTVCSLAAAMRDKPELVEKYLGTVAPGDDPSVALNTLLMQDGVLIHVAQGKKAEHLIQIVSIFNSPAPLLAARRILIVLEDNASAEILLCDHTVEQTNNYLSSEVIEIIAGRHSRLDIIALEESNLNTVRYSKLYARQQEGSDININTTTLYNGNTRNEFHIDIDGSHAVTELSGMAITTGSRHIDNYSNVRHLAPHAKSNQLFKYLVDDNATGAFEGGIYVDKNAPFSEGYQSNRNILASEGARMYSKPQLLIYNDEVKCSHGAATGQLDEKQLFYMQTRGIPLNIARQLLMQAFMTDAIARVRIDAVRSRLQMLVEKRLSGENASCSDSCGATGCSGK